MSKVSFLAQLDPGILSIECFPLTYDLRFLVCFNLFEFLFLVTTCLVVAVQHPCME